MTGMGNQNENNEKQPLMVFGAVADIQYGDFDDGYNFHKTHMRYYRNALKLQAELLEQWKRMSPKVEFILQLGDIIDGFNKKYGISEQSLQKTLELFKDSKAYHVIGNHEIYNFKRAYLQKTDLFSAGQPECQSCPVSVDQNSGDQWYYTLLPHPSLRIIALDEYEISVLGWPESSTNYQEAFSKFLVRNPNEDKNSPADLVGEIKSLVKYNGGVGDKQLQWLDELLTHADKNNENVVIMGHLPIYAPASSYAAMCWNSREVLSVLHKHKAVLCFLAGHDHNGGSAIDDHGIQHITLPAVLETPPGEQAPIATIYLYNKSLFIKGQGSLSDFDISLPFPVSSS